MKRIKHINAIDKEKRLKITFKDGSLGQLTYQQIEKYFFGKFYLPDMMGRLPESDGRMVVSKTNQNTNSSIVYNNSLLNKDKPDLNFPHLPPNHLLNTN